MELLLQEGKDEPLEIPQGTRPPVQRFGGNMKILDRLILGMLL